MKAAVCRKWGPPESLKLETVKVPELKDGEVLVQVKACSANFPDMLLVAGKYQAKPKFPFVPGSDIAGVVVKAAEDGIYSVGDHVMAMMPMGGFAEFIACPEQRIIPIPEGMEFTSAAASMMAHGTSYYALKQRGKLKKKEKLLVLGAAGGCGMAAVMLGKAMGAHVIAAASTSDKLEAARKAGADEVVQYTRENLKKRVKELTDGKGVDVVFDPVGGKFSEAAVRSMRWGGRYLIVGFAAGEIPRIPLNLLLLKTASLVGVFWGAWLQRSPAKALENMMEIQEMMQKGLLSDMVTKKYALKDAWKALDDIKRRRAVGKIVVTVDGHTKSKL
mmetsp:Transcript_25510/g.61458  ORF Transcript_25510/g.61458 Transcript_25510/m.61458 type:complete len:332 (+) Transcript_25510:224-1219(+)